MADCHLGEGHTVHLHGLDTAMEHDGVPETFEPGLVRQGGSYTYRFVATHAGTYFYHCHQNNVEHQQMGMFGPLVVRPPTAYVGGPGFDREEILVLSEMEAEGHEGARRAVQEGADPHNWLGYAPSHFLINEKLFSDASDLQMIIPARPGERVLVRAINAGYATHALRTGGEAFTVVASDGRPWPGGPTSDRVWIGPGEKYDLLFSSQGPITLRDDVNGGYPGPVLGADRLVAPTPISPSGDSLQVTLYARAGVQPMPDGAELEVLGLSDRSGDEGRVPGPLLTATEGQVVEVAVVGEDLGPLEVLGLGLPIEGPLSGNTEGTAVYRFTAGRAGSYLYRLGPENSSYYGGLVVKPVGRQSAYRDGPEFDVESTMVLSELDLPGAVHQPNYFLINGRAYPDTHMDPASTIHPQPGDRVLIRAINAGRLPRSMHLHGYHFNVIGREGRPWLNGPLKDTVLTAPGESYDLLFLADQEGAFPFHDHFEVANTNNGVWLGGMHTIIATGAAYQAFCPLPSLSPALTPESETQATAFGSEQTAAATVFVRDNFYTPTTVTVPVGATVEWEHQGRVEHTVTSLFGYFDSGPLRGGSSFRFTFTQPGRYDYFCRFHITNRGVVIVT